MGTLYTVDVKEKVSKKSSVVGRAFIEDAENSSLN